MLNPWYQELWYMLAMIALMSLLGLLVGQMYLFLLVTVSGYLSWHMYNLYRLENWFRKSKKFETPDAPGIWGDVYYYVYRIQQRNRKRKHKLTSILKRFKRSTAAMPDATVVLKDNYEIEWFNKAAVELLGLKSPQDRGQVITNLLRYPSFREYLRNEQQNTNTSLKLTSPISPNRMLRVHVVPYAGNRYLLLARDVTHVHHLEKIRTDFIANVSHELRTPLTVISGFIETMQDAEADECNQQWERPLLLMAQQTARMHYMIDDLLLLSRLESDASVGKKTLVNVPDLLHMLHEESHVLSGDKNHNISIEIDEQLKIKGHSEELRSAFSNLISNAIRYTPAEGKITVRWYQQDGTACFEVHDTGEGIAPEHIPRLTERFYRVDVGRSRNQGGTGLGLAIVKHVLNRHSGQLQIESEIGQFSIFRCIFSKDIVIVD